MTFDDLSQQAEDRHLKVLGGFHPDDDPHLPANCRTLLLLGPNEPQFWPAVQASPEWKDGKSDPIDRWSTRVIGEWASGLKATPLFPFGGPPFLPFFSWATKTGRIHPSPIMLLVHDTAGLFVSFRGALALSEYLEIPPPPPNPCLTCSEKPCKTACPVDAFDGNSYDTVACKGYLGDEQGAGCMTKGCVARRSCPVSVTYPRLHEQSAYHMREFKG